jgi:hypothetical protein
MRFHVAALVAVCVAALLACAAHAAQLKATADQRALLRNSVRNEMAVAGPLKAAGKAAKSGTKAAGNVASTATAGATNVANTAAAAAADAAADAAAATAAAAAAAAKAAAAATAAIDSYVDKELVDDLKVVGNAIKNQLDKLVCGNEIAYAATVISCSISLAAGVCSATSGAAPGCVPSSFKLMEKVAIAVGLSAVSIIFRCTYYHILKTIPGLCRGRAYGIAQFVANSMVSDPYTNICTASIGCGCGPESCMFACANEEQAAICEGATYTNAMKSMLDILD